MSYRYKHSSLLGIFVNYDRKKFYKIGTWSALRIRFLLLCHPLLDPNDLLVWVVPWKIEPCFVKSAMTSSWRRKTCHFRAKKFPPKFSRQKNPAKFFAPNFSRQIFRAKFFPPNYFAPTNSRQKILAPVRGLGNSFYGATKFSVMTFSITTHSRNDTKLNNNLYRVPLC
jgi:hypothetical protein